MTDPWGIPFSKLVTGEKEPIGGSQKNWLLYVNRRVSENRAFIRK